MEAAPASLHAACFHCGLPVPTGLDLSVLISGTSRAMCCIGCAAVAEMLVSRGLADWYEKREKPAGVQASLVPDILEEVVVVEEDESECGSEGDLREAILIVEGITCAACAWLIERHLEGVAGVRSSRVNLGTHRLRVEWAPGALSLRDIIARVAEVGFIARPSRADTEADVERRENRSALIRLGVSGLGAMNVMTYAVALYAGAFEGMEEGYRGFLRWTSLIVTTPVVLVGAKPFFEGAIRDLRQGRPGMDVPVSLAIGGAFLLSGWATFRGEGEVYFDSACMFTFFLSVGRYLEMRARHHSSSLARRMIRALPRFARRVEGEDEELIPAHALISGDRFVVRPGEAVPADGRIISGTSAVDEAWLTGEPWSRSVGPGEDVTGGSINTTSPLLVEAVRVGRDSALAAIVRLMERAQSEKPPVARAADRAAVVFVSVVLLLALFTATFWGWYAPEQAVWTTLAVLIATCPCALSLATPAAIASATQGLGGAGLLITRGHVLEGLASADRVVFDKTGTLTQGRPHLLHVVALRDGFDRTRCLSLARRLEQHSEHPLARAVMDATAIGRIPLDTVLPPGDVISKPGCGVEGVVDGVRTRLGRPAWVGELAGNDGSAPPPELEAHTWALLGDDDGTIGWLGFGDETRTGLEETLEALRTQGLALEMLSGDPSQTARQFARRLGLEIGVFAATPAEKLRRVQDLEQRGERVIMVGDGVNDGPVLAAADVSIAMGSGSDLTRLGADAILLRDNLALLPRAIGWSRRTRAVIHQNLIWAVAYNLVALPLALTGHLAPWLAAAGMSASSLVVVLNATRLRHRGDGL